MTMVQPPSHDLVPYERTLRRARRGIARAQQWANAARRSPQRQEVFLMRISTVPRRMWSDIYSWDSFTHTSTNIFLRAVRLPS